MIIPEGSTLNKKIFVEYILFIALVMCIYILHNSREYQDDEFKLNPASGQTPPEADKSAIYYVNNPNEALNHRDKCGNEPVTGNTRNCDNVEFAIKLTGVNPRH